MWALLPNCSPVSSMEAITSYVWLIDHTRYNKNAYDRFNYSLGKLMIYLLDNFDL